MLHLVAYNQSQDTSGNLTVTLPVPDGTVFVSGNDVRVPNLNQVVACGGLGTAITLAQLQAPSLRARDNFDMNPLTRQAAWDFSHQPIYLPANPLVLVPGEPLNFFAAEDGAGAQRQIGGVWLSDGITPVVAKDSFTVRFTGTTTLVANTWTLVTLTASQTLPYGEYDVVGIQAFSATGIFGRLFIPNYAWRPGVPASQVQTERNNEMFRYGRMGVLGHFQSTAPPAAEFLATGADTAQTVFMDLVKTA